MSRAKRWQMWTVGDVATVLAMVAAAVFLWAQIPEVHAARAWAFGVAGEISVEHCGPVPDSDPERSIIACSGRFVSADGTVVLPEIRIDDPQEADAGRTMPAWVAGPDADVAYVHVDEITIGAAAGPAVLAVGWLLWKAARRLVSHGRRWRRNRPRRRAAVGDAVSEQPSAGLVSEPSLLGEPGLLSRPSVRRSPSEVRNENRSVRWDRVLLSVGGGVLTVVTGLLMIVGLGDAFVVGPFSSVKQVRARYLGVQGTVTTWDCGFEWYRSTGRNGSSQSVEVLTCKGSFRGEDGVILEGLEIYRPRAEEIDRPQVAWVVGPDAEWAFTSVEWDMVALAAVVTPIFLAAAGFAVYQGGLRLSRAPVVTAVVGGIAAVVLAGRWDVGSALGLAWLVAVGWLVVIGMVISAVIGFRRRSTSQIPEHRVAGTPAP